MWLRSYHPKSALCKVHTPHHTTQSPLLWFGLKGSALMGALLYPVPTPSDPSLAISTHTSYTLSYLTIGLHLRVSISLSDLHSTTSQYLCMSPSPYSYSLCSFSIFPYLCLFSVLPDYDPVWSFLQSLSHNSLSPSPCISSLCPSPYVLSLMISFSVPRSPIRSS